MSDLPSVTQILGDVFGRNHFWTDEGRVKGSIVHALLAADNRGELDTEELLRWYPEYVGYIEGWRAIREPLGRIIGVEREVVASNYIGHLDVALQLWETVDIGIIDFKCGAAEPSHALQTAAYADAYLGEPCHISVKSLARVTLRACCYLDADASKCKLVPHTDPQDYDDWRAALAWWYAFQRRKGWKRNGL
jgi:hypothetical protein